MAYEIGCGSMFDQAMEVARHLPPGPFSVKRFVDHATGLNALTNVADAEPMLASLREAGVIMPLGSSTSLWITAEISGLFDRSEDARFGV